MHSHCFGQYTKYNYTCPVCSKSMGDMSVYFRMIDSLTARIDDLPPEYASRRQVGRWSAGWACCSWHAQPCVMHIVSHWALHPWQAL